MQIAHRIEFARRGIDSVGHRRCIEFRCNERGYVEPQRPVADATHPERNLDAIALLVERDLRRRGDKGKVRAPRADLEEAGADAQVATRPETGSR